MQLEFQLVGPQYETLKDGILAYEFVYPIEAAGRKIALVPSRKPERYSSAAPLSADAKQRIVAELVDFSDRATISVTVSGPRLHKQMPAASLQGVCIRQTMLAQMQTAACIMLSPELGQALHMYIIPYCFILQIIGWSTVRQAESPPPRSVAAKRSSGSHFGRQVRPAPACSKDTDMLM